MRAVILANASTSFGILQYASSLVFAKKITAFPALFIVPISTDSTPLDASGTDTQVIERFRLVYVFTVDSDDDVPASMQTDVKDIVEALAADYDLSIWSTTQPDQVLSSAYESIEWAPEEDELAEQLGRPLKAVAINWVVTWRSGR